MIAFSPKPGCAAQLKAAAPLELVHVNTLRAAGVLRDLFISKPGHAWLVLEATDRDEVELLLREFPMYPYVEAAVDALTN